MPAKHLSNDALGILFQDRRKFYQPENTMKELWTDATPFTTIIANMSQGVETDLNDPEYKMFEHYASWMDQRFTINSNPGAWDADGAPGKLHANEFTITDKKGLGDGPLDESLIGLVFEVYSSSGEYKGVVSGHDVGSTGLKVRTIGNPRAADNKVLALAENDVLVVNGSAIGEGQTSPEAFADDLNLVWNSCQIFRTPVEVTGTLYKAALRGYSNELARLRNDKGREHKIQKERGFLTGVRSMGVGQPGADGVSSGLHTKDKDGKTVRTTNGIIPTLYKYGNASEMHDDQNVFMRAYASYTYNKFVEDSEKWFYYDPVYGYATAIVGPTVMSFFSMLGEQGFHKGNQKVTVSDLQRDGLKFYFRWLETPHGMVKLVKSPALRKEYRNHMVMVQPENIKMMRYRPSYYATNIKTENNYDGVKDEYFSDEGLKINLINTHRLVVFS